MAGELLRHRPTDRWYDAWEDRITGYIVVASTTLALSTPFHPLAPEAGGGLGGKSSSPSCGDLPESQLEALTEEASSAVLLLLRVPVASRVSPLSPGVGSLGKDKRDLCAHHDVCAHDTGDCGMGESTRELRAARCRARAQVHRPGRAAAGTCVACHAPSTSVRFPRHRRSRPMLSLGRTRGFSHLGTV